MRGSTLQVSLDGITYLVDEPKLDDGLKATISAIREEPPELGQDSHILHRDRFNLDVSKNREKFAEAAGTDPAHLTENADRVRDFLTPIARPRDETPEDEIPPSLTDPAVVEEAMALLENPTLLRRLGEEIIRPRGYAGDVKPPTLLYLALTSRLTSRPVNVLISGPSSAGKSFLMESVPDCFPAAATYAIGAASERALVYTDATLQHRHLLISEAAAIHRDGVGALIMRSIIWGNQLQYEITEQDIYGSWHTRRICKPGPTGLVTTSVKSIEPELETWLLTLTVPDDEQTTRDILHARGERATGARPETPDLRPWHEAERWLTDEGTHEVIIPFASQLAALFPAKLVRARRDFEQLITLIEASAILHQRQRQRDAHGRIITTEIDYRLVYDLAAPVFGAVAAEGVTPAVRETVDMVTELTQGEEGSTVSAHHLGTALNLGKAAVSRRIALALKGGFLVNEETGRGKPYKLRVGDPLPDEATLPSPDVVFSAAFPLESRRTVEHSPETPRDHAKTTIRVEDANALAVRIEHPRGSNGAGEHSHPHSDEEFTEVFEGSHGFVGGEANRSPGAVRAHADDRVTRANAPMVAAKGADSLISWVNPDGTEEGIL